MELPLKSLPEGNYQGYKMFKGIAQSAVKFVNPLKVVTLKCSTKVAKGQFLSKRSQMRNYREKCGRITQNAC